MMNLSLIVAASENGVIGNKGDLPWHLSEDLKRFKRLTMGHHLIMGRRTFESIGRCLPGRTTIVLTRDPQFSFEGVLVAHSLEQAIEFARNDDRPFVVGGSQIYKIAMPVVATLFLTRILEKIDGDAFFPLNQIDANVWRLSESDGPFQSTENFEYQFETYERIETS